jgi:hypothetical protein
MSGPQDVPDGREFDRSRGAKKRTAETVVLTLPHALRYRLAYDGKLLGAVCRIFVDSVLGWYRRRLAGDTATKGERAR